MQTLKLWLKSIWQLLQRENLDRLFLIIGTILIVSAIGLFLLEPNLSLSDALWWSIVTVTTVGYGDIAPVTIGGRLIATVNMFLGIGVLATFSATLASILIDRKNKEELGMRSYNFENHIILCEWNARSRAILKELRLDAQTAKMPIVLIANLDRKPLEDPNLFFIQGNVSDETLNRANLVKASTVIILGDDSLDDTARDAKVILSTLTIESINSQVYTIVELVNEGYIQTCKRAKADEIIVSSELSSMLISQATLNHGITKVISDLLSSQDGNQLYKIAIPPSKVGSSFVEVLIYMKEVYQSIVLGVQKGSEGEVISNPPADYHLEDNDYLIIIGSEKPQLLL
ncbi:MAG TPA: cag pathogenicity island protein Cag26 [Cyanobacteria bacterium UBA8803]|nr:cag pathogenicity island protein Cag26 [Cyanobacteria bacterium UBA9273]HBL59168.1 cag pathogenicity island protein Cag26 [Cyanobacteria bacterium UBA8803]